MATMELWERCYRYRRAHFAGNAFREHRADLLTAVTDVHILANSLYSEGLISQEQLEHAQLLALTPSERKVHLFDAIEARLRSKPGDLYILINILLSDPTLQSIATGIKSSYANWFEAGLTMPGVHRGNYKLFGAARDMSTSNIKKTECGDESTENEECMPSESDTNTEKGSLLSGVRRGIRKLFGAARDMTTSFIKSTLSVLKLDVKIFRKYKKRFDKHTDHEQVRWWFEIWGDESALKVLESKWKQVSAENKWRLETCHPAAVPPQRC